VRSEEAIPESTPADSVVDNCVSDPTSPQSAGATDKTTASGDGKATEVPEGSGDAPVALVPDATQDGSVSIAEASEFQASSSN